MIKITVLITILLISNYAWASKQSCQLVAQVLGSEQYQTQPLRMAALTPPQQMTKEWQLFHLESHGAWHIYQAQQPWFSQQNCAPVVKLLGAQKVEFVPVLLNRKSGHNAVINGTFLIKIYRKQHWNKIIQRYDLKVLSPLPNPKTQIVDVKPVVSYDEFIKTLDKDKDVQLALPLLSEPN